MSPAPKPVTAMSRAPRPSPSRERAGWGIREQAHGPEVADRDAQRRHHDVDTVEGAGDVARIQRIAREPLQTGFRKLDAGRRPREGAHAVPGGKSPLVVSRPMPLLAPRTRTWAKNASIEVANKSPRRGIAPCGHLTEVRRLSRAGTALGYGPCLPKPERPASPSWTRPPSPSR